MSGIRLHFEPNLDYQHRAIDAVCGLFEGTENGSHAFSVMLPTSTRSGETKKLGLSANVIGNQTALSSGEVLQNLRAIQERNGIEQSQELKPGDWNFTVEMETGTGKTYVYLRTIYELNKRYGFKKFVIVVPSIAIKEGVDKSISIMKDHFRTLYDGVEMNAFTYDATRISDIRSYGISDKLQIMICTIQSIIDIQNEASGFNDTAKRKGGKKATRKMHEENEKTDGRKPIEFIRECKPIVIIDEPQNIGTKGEEKGIACLHPLCTLRYSATHKNLFHPVYCLNAVDASVQKLVKSIEVASIQSDLTHVEPYIKLLGTSPKRGGSAKLEVLTKTAGGDYGTRTCEVQPGTLLGMLCTDCPGVYDDVVVQEVHENYVVCSHSEQPLYVGQSTGGRDEMQITRAMIRATIEEHMRKEADLRPKGIKVLSLFFIDKVSDYRQYDKDRNQIPGYLASMFEEEYEKVMRISKYRSLYDNNPPSADKVHDGYFSIDKGKKGQSDIWTDTEDNAEGKKAAQRAYALIMRDKERLLSMDEPLKFIFSHSALREGWDNPNVFQVCVLRDMESKISRRQALGRGLRICVNQKGVRVRESGINTLTVVAREDFRTYADKLQKEYESDGVRFGVVTKGRLGTLEYADAEGNTVRLGQELAEVVIKDLQEKKLLTKEGKPTEELKKAMDAGTYHVPEECRQAQVEIFSRLRQLTRNIEIKDARARQTVGCRHEKMRLDKDFLELWNRIKKKTTYRVQFDSEELIRNATARLDAELVKIKAPMITKTVTQTQLDETGILLSGKPETTSTTMDTSDVPVGDILTALEEATHLTRKTLSRILTGTHFLKAIRFNGPQFEKIVQNVVLSEMKKLMVKGVSYKSVTIGQAEYNAQEIFRDTEGYLDKMIETGEKCMMDHVIWDSEVEREFARAADASTQVKMYVKLPHDFRIHTPLGPYNPDWALVLDIEGKNHLYFVVETKDKDLLDDLRDTEKGKIQCAEIHFSTIADGLPTPARYLAPIQTLSDVIARA